MLPSACLRGLGSSRGDNTATGHDQRTMTCQFAIELRALFRRVAKASQFASAGIGAEPEGQTAERHPRKIPKIVVGPSFDRTRSAAVRSTK